MRRQRQLNKYDLGSWMLNLGTKAGITEKGENGKLGLTSMGGGLVSSIGSAVNTGLNKGISGGLNSKAGNAVAGLGNAVGSVVSNFNPVLGAAIQGVSGLVGGGINRLWGNKFNDANIANIDNTTSALNTMQFASGSNSDVMNSLSNFLLGDVFAKSDVGKEGIFSNAVTDKYREMLAERQMANQRATQAAVDAVYAADNNMDMNIMLNFHAFGGNLYEDGSFIFPQFTKTNKTDQAVQAWNAINLAVLSAKNENSVTNTSKLKLDLSVRPMTEKEKAQMTTNGVIYSPLGLYTHNVLIPAWDYILNANKNNKSTKLNKTISGGFGGGKYPKTGGGGTTIKGHVTPIYEPYVERDTTIIPIPAVLTFNDAFAEARRQGLDTFEFNGKLYNTNLGNNPNNFDAGNRRIQTILVPDTTIDERQKQRFVGYTPWTFGGNLNTQGADFTNGITYINNGGTHELNPHDGVLFGVDQEGNPNLVEEGEVVFNNEYVFSNNKSLKIPKELRSKYKLGGELTFADGIKKLNKEAEERPNDPISKNGVNAFMPEFMVALEIEREKKYFKQALRMNSNKYPLGGIIRHLLSNMLDNALDAWLDPNSPYLPSIKKHFNKMYKTLRDNDVLDFDFSNNYKVLKDSELDDWTKKKFKEREEESLKKDTEDGEGTTEIPKFDSPLRYAPVAGNVLGLVENLLSNPDLSSYNTIRKAASSIPTPQVSSSPIGGYYKPYTVSLDLLINPINALIAAARNNAINTSNGVRGVALNVLANLDYNAINAIGDARLKTAEANAAENYKAFQGNNIVELFNSGLAFDAAKVNAAMQLSAYDSAFKGLLAAEEYRNKELERRRNELSMNASGLTESLGNVGVDDVNNLMYMWTVKNGVVKTPSAKYGGKIKRRKGFTI